MKISQWIFGIIFLALIPVTVWITGIGWLYFVDIPSFLIVFIGGYLLSLMSHGARGVASAYRMAGRDRPEDDPADMAGGIAVFRGLKSNFLFASFFGAIMGLIAVLTVFEQPERMAQGLATLIITLLYAVVAILILVHPFLHRLEQKAAILTRK